MSHERFESEPQSRGLPFAQRLLVRVVSGSTHLVTLAAIVGIALIFFVAQEGLADALQWSNRSRVVGNIVVVLAVAALMLIEIARKKHTIDWFGVRLIVARFGFWIFHAFNVVSDRRRIVLLSIGILTPFTAWFTVRQIQLEQIRPHVTQLIADMAHFLNVEPPEPVACANARVVVERHRAMPLAVIVDPAAASFVDALDTICPTPEDTVDDQVEPFDTRVRDAIGSLPKSIGDTLVYDGEWLTGLLALTLTLRQSDQGRVAARVFEARLILDSLWNISDSSTATSPAWESLRDAQANAKARVLFYCAKNYQAYQAWSVKNGRISEEYDNLLHQADRIWRAVDSPSVSSFSRIRALNNRADLLLWRLRHQPKMQPGSRGHIDFEDTTEDTLQRLRDELIELLPIGHRPELMVTVAQIDCVLAHGQAQLALRQTESNADIIVEIDNQLGSALLMLDMAFTLGLRPDVFRRDPHEFGLCWLLNYANRDRYTDSAVDRAFLQNYCEGRTLLRNHGVQFRCATCPAEVSVPDPCDAFENGGIHNAIP